MKKQIFTILFFQIAHFLSAQVSADSLRNQVWISGYEYNTLGSINHVIFDFRHDSLELSYRLVPNSLYMYYTNASICDTAGNLLFFSNGCGVMDTSFQYVPGVEHMNVGPLQDYACEQLGGGPYTNTVMVLPDWQGKAFHLIHTRPSSHPVFGIATDRVFWSKINQADDGHLSAAFVDSTIVDSLLYSSGLSACRHANGRDWWVVAPGHTNDEYFVLKTDTSGIKTHWETIGMPTIYNEDASGEAVFSPDGSKYARYTISSDLRVFDFDRCTGRFSNPVHVPILDAADTVYAAGVAFSPSGQYLYAASSIYIYQFDVQTADIAASKVTVAVLDSFTVGGLPTGFYQCELAPDGRIYVSCPGGKRALHVIERPDSAGLACQVVQHKYVLQWPIIGGLPHFPNFCLGPTAEVCPEGQVAVAGFSWQVADTLLPLQVQFTDQSLHSPSSWHWDFGDPVSGGANISQDTNPVHIFTMPGTYQVCQFVGNALGSDTLCQWVTVTTSGSEEAEWARWGLRVFPNPTTGIVQWAGSPQGEPVALRVHDALGRLCLERETLEGRANLGGLPDGAYFVTLLGAGGRTGAAKAVVLAKEK